MNFKHNNIITQDFNASYSFNNEVGYIGTNISYIDLDNDNIMLVIDNEANHNTVLKYNTSIAWKDALHHINHSEYGTIEFWIRLNQVDITSILRIRDGVIDSAINLEFKENGQLSYYDGSYHIILWQYNSNQWYHFRIDFQCGVGIGYMGLNSQWKLFIDNIEYGNYNFHIAGGNPIAMDDFEIIANINCIMIFDAIGFSWLDNYSIGLNKYPIIETIDSNILTPDKYEFNLDNEGNPYSMLGFPEPDYFQRVGVYSFYVYPDKPHFYDKSKNVNGINILADNDGGTASGIRNYTLGIHRDKINISFGIQFIEMIELNSYITFTLNSLNNTEIINLKFNTQTTTKTTLQYYDGSSYQDLFSIYGIDSTITYSFNLHMYNYSIELSWYKNDIYNNTFSFPLISNQLGINQLFFYVYDKTNNYDYYQLRLNYIGIYQYNISLTRELSYLSYDLLNNWNFQEYNIVNLISNEALKILSYSTSAIPNHYIIRNYDNKDIRINLYSVDKVFNNPYLYLIMNYSFFNYSDMYFSITGIKMNEYRNDIFYKNYNPIYSSLNIDTSSYFYVDNTNKLNYFLNIKQNDTFEHMTIYFNIDSQYTVNKSFHFKGISQSGIIGYPMFRLAYLLYYYYSYISFDLYSSLTSYNYVLPSGRNIDYLLLFITDKNNNNFTSYNSKGYIYELELRDFRYDIISDISIITLTLIDVLIPIIIIIIPTLAIYSIYRKKEIIFPLLLLMSIICFISELIPLELFFIIITSLIIGIFLQYKSKRD